MTTLLFTGFGVEAQEVKLPAPDKKGGSSLMETLWQRKSEREFSNKELSQKDLSNLLWAACGVNRPNDGKRTNPTARNLQEVTLYVFFADRVCCYDHKAHSLTQVAKGDHRALLASGQEFVLQAPVTLLMVANMESFGEKGDIRQWMGAVDAGIVSENINLFCAAYGFATVPRFMMDRDALTKLLGLSDKQVAILNNPVGYRK